MGGQQTDSHQINKANKNQPGLFGFGLFFRKRSGLGYLGEVGLIIFSILFAFWIERIRESREKEAKRNDYLREIAIDLDEEISATAMNLYDCKYDIRLLRKNLQYVVGGMSDSTENYRQNFLSVFYRGVYRSFSTTTIEIMATQGDLNLLKDDSLQKQLLSVFALRKSVENEFKLFDSECANAGKVMFKDLQMMQNKPVHPDSRNLYASENTEALFSLLRRAEYKGFIMEAYLDDLKAAQKKLKGRMDKPKI